MNPSTVLRSPTQVRLDFSTGKFHDATLSVNGVRVYDVVTSYTGGHRIIVQDVSTSEPIITLKKNDFFSDSIKFKDRNGGKSMSIKKWLKKNKGSETTFSFGVGSETYEWKNHPKFWLALYHSNNPVSPVAYLDSSSFKTPSIVMESSTSDFRDLILGSFLVAEQGIKGRRPDFDWLKTDAQQQAAYIQMMDGIYDPN